MRAAKLSLEDQFPIVAQEGVIDLVKQLREKKLPLGILSSSLHDLVVNDLQRLGFPIEAFVMIQGSESTTAHKPEAAVFSPILSRLKQEGVAKNIVYVGDALSDYQAARAAGLHFIAVTTGTVSRETFEHAGVKIILDNLTALADHLE
jgi:phosphoglycolate phosphatase-like HAD superfamily hydrolase